MPFQDFLLSDETVLRALGVVLPFVVNAVFVVGEHWLF
jgi:hypothetical protein